MDPWIIGGSCVIGWAACGAAGAKLADWVLRPTLPTLKKRRPWIIAAACLGPVVPAIALLFLLMITIFALLGIMK